MPRLQPLSGSGHKAEEKKRRVISSAMLRPLRLLQPYASSGGAYVVKVQVVGLMSPRRWGTNNQGLVASVDFRDEEETQIHAVMYNTEVDRCFGEVRMGNWYYIGAFRIKPSNRRFTRIENDYELAFGSETWIQSCDAQEQEEVAHSTVAGGLVSTVTHLKPGEVVSVTAMIHKLKANEFWTPWYLACTTRLSSSSSSSSTGRECGRSINEEGFCMGCGNRENAPRLRYKLRFLLSDDMGSIWVTAFDQVVETLLGIPVHTLSSLWKRDIHSYSHYLQSVVSRRYTFQLTMQASSSSSSSSHSTESVAALTSYQVINMTTLDYMTECDSILKDISILETRPLPPA